MKDKRKTNKHEEKNPKKKQKQKMTAVLDGTSEMDFGIKIMIVLQAMAANLCK